MSIHFRAVTWWSQKARLKVATLKWPWVRWNNAMFTTHDGYGWFMALFYQRKPLKYTQNHMFDLIPAKKMQNGSKDINRDYQSWQSPSVTSCSSSSQTSRKSMGWHGDLEIPSTTNMPFFLFFLKWRFAAQKTIFAMSQGLAFTFSCVCEHCGHSPSLHGKKLVISLRQTLAQPCVTEGFAQDKVLMTGSQLKHCKTCILRNTPVCFKPPKPGAPPKLDQ